MSTKPLFKSGSDFFGVISVTNALKKKLLKNNVAMRFKKETKQQSPIKI